MSVTIELRLSEAEASALLKAERRAGWFARPSMALRRADFKIREAIIKRQQATTGSEQP